MRKAAVFMDGILAGQLEELTTDKGITFVFTYDEDYQSQGGIPVSITMPTTTARYESKPLHSFFNGLIPEGWLLSLAARKLGVETKDRMGLLLSLCENNIGAAEIKSESSLKLSPLTSDGDEIRTISSQEKEYEIPKHPICLACLLPLKAPGDNRNYHEECSQKLFGHACPPLLKLTSDHFESPAMDNLKHKLSLTGVQAKFSAKIRYDEDEDSKGGRRTIKSSPEYIFKPEPVHTAAARIDYRGLSKFEQLSLVLARRLGIPTVESGLLYLEGGPPVFVTKRFDRSKTGKIHAEDFAQILDRTFGDDKYTGSMEQIFKATSSYTRLYRAASLEALLKATLLNFVIGNSDNHNKNFSLIIAKSKSGSVEAAISPFYDIVPTLVFISADDEETALTIGAKKTKLKAEHFYELAKRVPAGHKIIEKFIPSIKSEYDFIETTLAGLMVPKDKKETFLSLVKQRLARFEQ